MSAYGNRSKPSPAKVAIDTTPKAATPKKSAAFAVAGKSVNNVSAQSTAPQKPASVKVNPANPTSSKAKKPQTTKFLVPYNVSLGNNPTPPVNTAPHCPTQPQVDRDESSASLKRPLDTSGDVVEASLTKKKPREEPTSDPGALVHLEEIIDAAAVGLDDPDDFAIESPFTQLTADEQSVVEENDQVETTVMNYQEFVETIPRKKKSKKHRRPKETEVSSILE
ncbi:unnamed protein product [Hymenolepis diminuta]|uniref:DUF4604 domain-containing protein n=1 Tax=Hymenolepis diminuta TaxID=6216 RepID=A0A0R3SL41_HYMDI|nr:unnamed protein product [Hymenolepis diminuta]